MKFTLFATFLFSIGWTSVVAAENGPPPDCCRTVKNTQIQVGLIVSYEIQERAPCPVRAIRFHTQKNKVICSDPENEWAKYAMMIVDRRTRPKSTARCIPSTTNVIPATVTTDKTQQTETETSIRTNPPPTSTSVPPTVTTTKTSGPETSTAVPPIMTTIKTTSPETKISSTALPPVSVSKDISELTAITCGTTITTETTARTTIVTKTTKKLSKMMIRRIGKKSKKGLRKNQNNFQKTAKSTVSS